MEFIIPHERISVVIVVEKTISPTKRTVIDVPSDIVRACTVKICRGLFVNILHLGMRSVISTKYHATIYWLRRSPGCQGPRGQTVHLGTFFEIPPLEVIWPCILHSRGPPALAFFATHQ